MKLITPCGAKRELERYGSRVIGGWALTLTKDGPDGLCCFSAAWKGGSLNFLNDVVAVVVDRETLVGPAPEPADAGTWTWRERPS